MVGRLSPRASARDANECRRSWIRTPSSPARARIRSQWSFRFERCPPGFAPGITQGLPGDPGQAGEDGHRSGGEGHHPRPRLAVAEAQLGRLEVHLLPAKGEDLVPAAAGQHEEAQRRRRRCPEPSPPALPGLRLDLVEDPPEPPELLLREEPLPVVLAVLADRAARVVAGAAKAPDLGEAEHPVEDRDHLVGPVGDVAEPEVEGRDVSVGDRADRQPAEGGEDPPRERPPVGHDRPRLAAHRHILAKEAIRELGHRDRALRGPARGGAERGPPRP